MKTHVPLTIILLLFSAKTQSQTKYGLKLEVGFLKFLNTTINVDPGPNWKGYYLDGNRDGIDINVINGVTFNEKIYTGIGFGFQNFEGIDGITVFGDLCVTPFISKLSPMISFKVGFDHLWNQYENGTRTVLAEIGGALKYKLKNKQQIFLQSGLMLTQQSALLPLRLGVIF